MDELNIWSPETAPQRRSKLVSIEDAISLIPRGGTLGVGGWTFYNTPMALLAGVVRAEARGLHLACSPGAIGPDMLLSAGCVDRLTTPFLTMEQFGFAPGFRRRAEAGEIKVFEVDGPAFACALRAAADDMPTGFIHDSGTDLPSVNPAYYMQSSRVNSKGRALFEVPALVPDVAFIHAQQGDEFGNLQFLGATYFDQLLARASKLVVATVDELVNNATIRSQPRLTKIPGLYVSAVVHQPRSAAPCASHGLYSADLERIEMYAKMARTPEGAHKYLAENVL